MKQFCLNLAVIFAIAFATNVLAADEHYSIVVDAGSSGSRLHVFQYDTSAKVPIIKDIFSESTKPGLSSYAKNPQAAGASLKKLLEDAAAQLEKDHIDPHTISINVLATAGMRLLPEEQQQKIYDNVTDFIKSHSVFVPGDIETIPGKMEGLYGWLDVNYLEENFQNNTVTDGAIDMGGASTEITFATHDTSKADDEVTLQLNGTVYTVFTKSFLGLGQEQARGSIDNMPDANTCYPQGYNDVGNFNFSHCDALFAKLIQEKAVAQQIPAFGNMKFIGFSGIYYAYHDFLGLAEDASRASVDAAISHFCQMPWEQLKQEFPPQLEKYVATYCANSVYFDDLLYNTYKLQDGELIVKAKIKQQDIDWTLGSVLYSLISHSAKL